MLKRTGRGECYPTEYVWPPISLYFRVSRQHKAKAIVRVFQLTHGRVVRFVVRRKRT